MDEHGNRYYENPLASHGYRRFVIYPNRKHIEASTIAPYSGWYAWLHGIVDELPNEQNLRRYPWQLPIPKRESYLWEKDGLKPEWVPKVRKRREETQA